MTVDYAPLLLCITNSGMPLRRSNLLIFVLAAADALRLERSTSFPAPVANHWTGCCILISCITVTAVISLNIVNQMAAAET